MTAKRSIDPQGPFDLEAQSRSFGGWLEYAPEPSAVAMAFPVEGWEASAAVVLRQPAPSTVTGEVHGVRGERADQAWRQALAVLSLDVDASGFAAVGERDPAMGELLRRQHHLRPVLFHSPYEAACNFVIGQRISMRQARAIRARLAAEHGDGIETGATRLSAFPRPQVLLEVSEVRSLPAEKVNRLHTVARAALDGLLDRERLRATPVSEALAQLQAIHGVGPFSAQGTLHRGAGLVDEITDDAVSRQAVQRRYGLDHMPTHDEVLAIAEPWRPYRMWCLVHLHMWLRTEGGGPARARR